MAAIETGAAAARGTSGLGAQASLDRDQLGGIDEQPGDPGGPHQRQEGRGPLLKGQWNPCAGVFPIEATDAYGSVTVALDVSESGDAMAPRILSESPHGQGFAKAARSCANRLQFHPAVNGNGLAVPSTSLVRLKFARRPPIRREPR